MLPLILGITGSFFIGWFHLQRMLGKAHYQYIVILPLMIWLGLRSRTIRRVSVLPESLVSNIGILFCATCLCASSVVWSPWIAIASVLGAVLFFCIGTVSRKDALEWLPIWLLSTFFLPIPFGLDDSLTLKLREIATTATSQLLDFLGILHVRYANVIEVPGKKLFIADACSGVHSLYVLIAAAMFWCILQRRRFLHLFAMSLITFAVVLVENIVRLVTVAAGIRWQVDLSEGTDHQILGAALFVASVAVLLLTDRFLLFFLPNRKSLIKSETTPVRQTLTTPVILFNALNGVLFLASGIIQWQMMPGPMPNLLANFESSPALPLMKESSLPKAIEGLSCNAFQHIDRVPEDPFGQQSQQWNFADNAGLVVQVSIDYPFDGFHDCTVCYSQIGWTIESALAVEDIPAPYAIVHMNQKLEGDAVLVFCQVDQKGVTHARLKSQSNQVAGSTVLNRLKSLIETKTESKGPPASLPLIQFQLLARSSSRMTDDDLNRIERFFVQFRESAASELGLQITPHK